MDRRVVFVTYEEAQRLRPIFQWFAKSGPWKEVRMDARQILEELELVRPIDYTMGGKQVFLSEREHDFFTDVLSDS